MDMSGLGNMTYGYFLIFLPHFLQNGVANIDQFFNPGSLGTIKGDNPDDLSQRNTGTSIGQAVIGGSALTAQLVESAADQNGLHTSISFTHLLKKGRC